MSEQITFTTAAFGGFEKKQVLDYIYKIHEELDQEKSKHKKKLEEISVAFRDLETRAVTAEKKMVTLEKDLVERQQELKDRKTLIEELEEEKDQLHQRLIQYEQLLSQAQKPAASAVPPSVLPSQPDLKEEYQRIEESSAQIGRVMLEAHQKADEILNAAKRDANRMVSQAQQAVEDQRKNIMSVMEEHRIALNQETSSRLQQAEEQAQQKIQQADVYANEKMQELSQLSLKAAKQLEELYGQLEYFYNLTAQSTKEIEAVTKKQEPEVLEPTPLPPAELTPDIAFDFELPEFTLDPPSFSPSVDLPVEPEPPSQPQAEPKQELQPNKEVTPPSSNLPPPEKESPAKAEEEVLPSKQENTEFPTLQFSSSLLQEELRELQNPSFPSLDPPN